MKSPIPPVTAPKHPPSGVQTNSQSGALLPPTSSVPSQDNSILTVDRIFGKPEEFATEVWGPAYWLKDSSAYTTLELSEQYPDAKDLVRYSPESGQREIIVHAESLIPSDQSTPLKVKDYAFSPGFDKILIFTNSKRVWRLETRGDCWVLDRESGALTKLGGEAEPSTLMFATFSPDGQRVAYVCQNNLYVQSLDGLEITQLTSDGSATTINGTADWVNEEEFHLRNGLRWSPDGEFIAYWQFDATGVRDFQLVNYTDQLYPKITSYSYPKVGETNSACNVGVIKSTGGATLWFQPNDDPRNHYIPRMEWSQDSKQVLFQHLNRLQNTNQVLAGDPLTGELQLVLTDCDDAWVEVMDQWRWIENASRFLWLSERDGWQHLYAVSLASKEISLLTPGAYDVVSIAGIDELEGCVYFIASPENPTQRYLYRVPLDGAGDAVRVSPQDQQGTHTYDFSKDGKWAFHTYSSFGKPPHVDLVHLPDHKAVRVMAGNQKLLDKLAELTPCHNEFFRIPISDCEPLDAWCIKPPDFDPTKLYPLLIHVYGEPAGTTVNDKWGGEQYLWHSMIAQKGYIVISIDNRGTPSPRGRAWRKSVYRQIGILASQDQAAATREILRDRPYIDANRVGIWGWSGGGSMSLNAIFRYPDLYKTAMAVAFIANQRFYDTIYQERYMGLPADNEEGFKNGSPVTHAHQLQGNLLVVYGTRDDNCHYQNCEVMINELINHNKQFSQVSYPNCGHGLDEGENTKRHLYGTLARYLGDNVPVYL
jgi:dipeptidyl-peptidase-4